MILLILTGPADMLIVDCSISNAENTTYIAIMR